MNTFGVAFQITSRPLPDLAIKGSGSPSPAVILNNGTLRSNHINLGAILPNLDQSESLPSKCELELNRSQGDYPQGSLLGLGTGTMLCLQLLWAEETDKASLFS